MNALFAKAKGVDCAGDDVSRIRAEYERRDREIAADFYSWARPANLLMRQQVLRSCIRMLQRAGMFPLSGRRVADIGCGQGTWMLEFIQWGVEPADVSGIDLMPGRVDCARRRMPQADVRLGSAAQLPWPDRSFDLLTQFMLFMNIFDPALKLAIASEMLRVLKPGAAILWFDQRVGNPRNSQARGVPAAEIRSLFRGCQVDLKPALLAPPLSRLLAGWAWPLAEALHAVPCLRTHYVGLIHKPGPPESR